MSKEITFQELFVSAFVFIKKNFMILLIFFVIGIAAGLLKHFMGKPVYESRMTAISRINNEFDLENHRQRFSSFYSGELAANKIKTLKNALEKKNKDFLSKELQISMDSIEMLGAIEVKFLYPIEGTDREKDIVEIDYLEVKVEVNDNALLPKLEKGFVASVHNDPFISEKVKNIQNTTRQLIDEIDAEIEKIDKELERMAENQTKSSGNYMVLTNNSLHTEKVFLVAKKLKFEKTLAEYTPFKVVTSFVPSQKNENGLLKSPAIFGFVFLVLAFIFIIIRDLWILAKEREK